ncbi:YciI family protein [Geodermatophilus sp. YIM 151500]|uniref:YciI family protein n=1 Tax=Geodermatophilus sp. YIM 151500 TaxID=2984531 RepID=UPI0021E458B5|nr:YciI family protein [Geodermatophilus sp. YIM 151500]MCV2491618.1 YciI family protein [Geodermatophilus sp. YIM 151500]
MQYVMLLSADPESWGSPDAARVEEWATYTRALHEAGILVGGAGLEPPSVATTVRVRDGERLLTDGPFADTKEHLIGFYVIDVPDLDGALDWAARVPNVRTGSVDVRPVTPGTDTRTMLAATAAAG